MKSASPWYEKAFRRSYLDVYAHRSEEAALAEVSWIRDATSMKHGDLVLDLACGSGRHARALASGGLRLVAVDLSMDLLRAAGRDAHVSYLRADMRSLPLMDGLFDYVVNLFTSFGYFDSDRENALVIEEAARVLRPQGGFLMDFLNAPAVEKGLVPRSSKVVDGRRFDEVRKITSGRRRVEKTVTLIEDGVPTESWKESVRLFDRDEMTSMMRAAGLTVDAAFGGLDGRAWSPDAPRLVLVAHK